MMAKNKTRNVKFEPNIYTIIPMIFLALILILSLLDKIVSHSTLNEKLLRMRGLVINPNLIFLL